MAVMQDMMKGVLKVDGVVEGLSWEVVERSVDACIEADQWRIVLNLAEQGQGRQATQLCSFIASRVLQRKSGEASNTRHWLLALAYKQKLFREGVEASLCQSVLSFTTVSEWPRALFALRHGEMALPEYDALFLSCWRAEENQIAEELLKESQELRSAVSFLWGLSVLHEAEPALISPACVAAWVKLRDSKTVSNFDLITTWRSCSTLASYNPHLEDFLAAEVTKRILARVLSLEELNLVIQAANFVSLLLEKFLDFFRAVEDLALSFLSEATEFSFESTELLSIVFCCRLAQAPTLRLTNALRLALQRQGRALDGSISLKKILADEICVATSPDRPVLLKPPGWEAGQRWIKLYHAISTSLGYRLSKTYGKTF